MAPDKSSLDKTQQMAADKSSLQATDTASEDGEIRRAHKAIEDIYHCRCFSPNNLTFALSVQSYEELRQNLRDSGLLVCFEEEVRSDWSPYTGELTIRATVPSWVHEHMQESLRNTIEKELDCVARVCPHLKELRDNLLTGDHGGLGTKAAAHMSPDAQFHFAGTTDSPFVMEIAYNEEPVDLEAKVFGYFDGIPSVWTILTIDIDWLSPDQRRAGLKHRATVSLWEKKDKKGDDEVDEVHVVRLVDGDVFRQKNGVACPGQLRIPFKLFLPPNERTHKPLQDTELVVPYKDLAGMVKKGEDHQLAVDNKQPTRDGPRSKRKMFYIYDKDENLLEEFEKEGSQIKRIKINPSNEVFEGRTRSEAASQEGLND